MGVNLKALIGKCNSATRQALEAAAGLCLSRTHYDVEVEHYLMKLLDQTDDDFAVILKYHGIDRSRLASELTHSLDRLKSGNARNPALSPTLIRECLPRAGRLVPSSTTPTNCEPPHHIGAGPDELSRLAREISKELAGINAET